MKETWKWYVYIIECLDHSYYTGITTKPIQRFDQHIDGLGSVYTSKHGVKDLVYVEEWEDFDTARERERQIKNWSREKKQKLISGEWGKP